MVTQVSEWVEPTTPSDVSASGSAAHTTRTVHHRMNSVRNNPNPFTLAHNIRLDILPLNNNKNPGYLKRLDPRASGCHIEEACPTFCTCETNR
jgi:hypothetical protein